MKWTVREVDAMKPQEGQTKPRDLREKSGDGFGLTIFPSGEKSFIYIYHFGGRKRRMTLGKYPNCSLGDAHKLHRKALKLLEGGKDPALEQKKEKIAERDSSTINGLIEEYLEVWAKPRKRSWKEDERFLHKNVVPYWGKLKADAITRRDVILLLDRIKERGAPIAANRGLACIRRMFNFGIERDIITSSPCAAVKAVASENRRDRVLSLEEINILWRALDQNTNQDNPLHVIHMSEQTKLIIKLQLTLAQRKGEIIGAEWHEMDLSNNFWTIPAHKAKNNCTHRVPLSSLALELLDKVKKLSGNSRFLFPAKIKNSHMEYGYLKMLNDPSKSPFEKMKPLFKDKNTLILFDNDLFYADQEKKIVNKIEITARKKSYFDELKSKFSDTYKLANFEELELILSLVSHPPHLAGTSIDHAVRRSTFDGVKPWTPHDCRRSASSLMTSLGISRLVVSKILNHSENNSITAIYDRHSYDNEKRLALETWAQKLKEITCNGEIAINIDALKTAT